MKIRNLTLFAIALAAAMPLMRAQQTRQDLAIGTWQFVPEGSTYQSGPAPSRSIRQWAAAPNGLVRFQHEGSSASGQEFHTEFLAGYDGKLVPFIGGTLYDSVALFWRNSHTVEQIFRLKGKVTVTAIRKISNDGKRMTIDSRGSKPDGTKFRNLLIYSRVEGKLE